MNCVARVVCVRVRCLLCSFFFVFPYFLLSLVGCVFVLFCVFCFLFWVRLHWFLRVFLFPRFCVCVFVVSQRFRLLCVVVISCFVCFCFRCCGVVFVICVIIARHPGFDFRGWVFDSSVCGFRLPFFDFQFVWAVVFGFRLLVSICDVRCSPFDLLSIPGF